MDKASFAKTVMPDMRTRSAAEIWMEYQRTPESFEGARGIGEGSDYYRSLVVPPVALGLSLFLSLVALVKLPVLLNELVYAMTKGRKDFRIWAKGLMVCGIAAIVIIPLMTPATTLSAKEQRVIGTAYKYQGSGWGKPPTGS